MSYVNGTINAGVRTSLALSLRRKRTYRFRPHPIHPSSIAIKQPVDVKDLNRNVRVGSPIGGKLRESGAGLPP